MDNENYIIDKCIDVINNLKYENCNNHSTGWGECVKCGERDNYFILPSPEEVIQALTDLKNETKNR